MRIVSETDINRPLAEVMRLMADPSNSKYWMEDLETYRPLSGAPGKPGSTAQLEFRSGRSKMAFTLTTLEPIAANDLRLRLEGTNMIIESTAHLTAMSPTKTHYVFEQDFQFRGLLGKLMSIVAKVPIRKQQKQHVQGFKLFVEKSEPAQ